MCSKGITLHSYCRSFKKYFSRESAVIDKEKIIKVMFSAIDEINEIRPPDQQLEKSTKTVLFGERGGLDSIGLVSFIVSVEQKVQEAFAKSITLADERALSQRNSPFRTVGALADYITNLLAGESGDIAAHGSE